MRSNLCRVFGKMEVFSKAFHIYRWFLSYYFTGRHCWWSLSSMATDLNSDLVCFCVHMRRRRLHWMIHPCTPRTAELPLHQHNAPFPTWTSGEHVLRSHLSSGRKEKKRKSENWPGKPQCRRRLRRRASTAGGAIWSGGRFAVVDARGLGARTELLAGAHHQMMRCSSLSSLSWFVMSLLPCFRTSICILLSSLL